MSDHPSPVTEITQPDAVAVDGGVDLLLPPSTPRAVLDMFVASCNVGECDCATTFVAKVAGVELFDEPRAAARPHHR